MMGINLDIPKAEWPTAKCPKKCKYLDTHQICSYYIDTGIRRPCPAGAGCTVADTGKKNRPFERMIVGADGTLVPKSRQASWDTKEARRLREQGMSYRDIAARLGVSKSAVVMYANRCWPDLVTKHADWDKERARAMREQGATYKAIAKAVEIPAHGRLVDADKLCKVLKARAADEWNQGAAPFSWSYAYECMADTVDTMPTVIPKEEA